jgi:hypothetical protein
MKTVLRIGALVAALTFAAPAAAQQQQQQQQQGRVGIGLGMPVNQLGQLIGIFGGPSASVEPQIFVPINISPNLRIEPQFGYFKLSDDDDQTDTSSFTLGAGVFFVKPVAQQTQLYLGGRLALNWFRDEDQTSPAKFEQTNVTIAGVFGGEYLPSPWFSVGAEAQLAYTSLGDPDVTDTVGVTTTGQGGSIFSTAGLLFLRVYFL